MLIFTKLYVLMHDKFLICMHGFLNTTILEDNNKFTYVHKHHIFYSRLPTRKLKSQDPRLSIIINKHTI